MRRQLRCQQVQGWGWLTSSLSPRSSAAAWLILLGLSSCPYAIERDDLLWACSFLTIYVLCQQWQFLTMEPPPPPYCTNTYFKRTGSSVHTFPVTRWPWFLYGNQDCNYLVTLPMWLSQTTEMVMQIRFNTNC